MRLVICCISVLFTSSVLIGCGQTGALQLPNDPNYDKRAKYLIYKDAESQKKTQEQDQDLPVQQEFSVPAQADSVTSP